ncbi:MAG: phage tail tape measure protein, partial [Bacteroidales bacterium]
MKADVNVGALVASLGMDTKEFEKALKNAKRSVDEAEENMSSKMKDIGKSMDKAGQSMQKFGRNLTQYVTLPLGTASGAALKLEKDFEKHMTKIVSLVGVAGDQVSAWRDDVLDLSSEVGRAPKELARGLYFITSAGLRGQEAMDVLTASAKASAAGLGDVKLVADNVTSALNAYKDTNLEASEATDILINAVRLGKVEAEDMAVAMGHVFPVASKLGVSFDQVAAAVASLTRTGTPAETAAVQIRQALGQLIGPAREAHGALNDLNWSSQEFREAIAEEGLFPAMETFVDKVEDFGNIEVAKKVFGNIRALTGIFDLMGGNIEHNRMIFEEMQDSLGRTNKAFEIVSATLDHKWNVALSNAKVAAIAVGEELKKVVIPILNDLADWLRNAVDWWGDLTDAEKQAILNWGKVVAAIGPVISIFGKLTALIGGVVKGTGKLISIFSKVASASIAVSGPIAAIIALLGSLAAATVYVVDNKEKFISTEKRAANMLKEVHKEYGKQIAQSTTLFQEL